MITCVIISRLRDLPRMSARHFDVSRTVFNDKRNACGFMTANVHLNSHWHAISKLQCPCRHALVSLMSSQRKTSRMRFQVLACDAEVTMRILILGSGAALPDPDRCQSSILITLDNGAHYLMDCGHGATRQLVRADVNPADVRTIFLTHLHHDHIGELPFFVISSWMLNAVGAPLIIGPAGTKRFAGHLFEGGAFDIDIRARAHYPARMSNIDAVRPQIREYTAGTIYSDDHVRVTAIEVDHIEPEIARCYGLRFEAEGKVVAYSGDTKPCAALATLAKGADVLIHDCTFPEAFIEHRRKSGVGTFAHTSPRELGKLAVGQWRETADRDTYRARGFSKPGAEAGSREAFARRIDGPASDRRLVADIRQFYSGHVRVAHDLMRIDL